MLLVTEYDKALEIESRVAPSLIRKVYLGEGLVPSLDNKSTLFGDPIHFVYLGYNLRSVEMFVKSLSGNTSNIVLISPMRQWGLYSVKLKSIEGLLVSDQFDTQESKVDLVVKLTGLNKTRAKKALNVLKYNFAAIEKNLDLLRRCNATGADVESALASVEHYSYTDVLFYLCGSNKHTREKFIRTLAKYRYAKKHMLKYLKDSLDNYIDYKLEGIAPPKDSQYLINRLSAFLYLEDAMRLRYSLDKVSDLSDLLKGEIVR